MAVGDATSAGTSGGPGMRAGADSVRARRRSGFRSGFWKGVAEALVIPALFAGSGLLARAWLEPPAPAPYLRSVQEPDGAGRHPQEIWLVDGFNVVSVGLLRGADREQWWRAPHRDALLARAARFDDPRAELWVVFDGKHPAGDRPQGPGPRTVFAASADDWLIQRVRGAEDPALVAVVTADRRLAGRARQHGARIVSPGEFLRRCPG